MLTHKMLSHALNDENAGPTGGAHGDQKGYELCCCPWYSYPWIAVYRPVSGVKGDGMARFMEAAVANGYIGYDQDLELRKETIAWLADHDYDVSRMNGNHCVDCSALVYAAVLSQYGIGYSGKGVADTVPKTWHFDEYLMEILTPADPGGGFEKLTDSSCLDSADSLIRGDILLADGHVAIWI